jgi:tRNA (pseudouridine54-N1)-methyltransferase
MASGKLPLNDLAGGAGRMDVLIRALMSALLTSHGLRDDTEVILLLDGGSGPCRRIRFVGSELRGFHAEERAVAGKIAAVIRNPMPPRGHWQEITPGIYDGNGDLQMTLEEIDWPLVRLEAVAPRLWDEVAIPSQSTPFAGDIAFILGDDKPLDCIQGIPRSLGGTWLQGHSCITLCHFLLDEGVELQL